MRSIPLVRRILPAAAAALFLAGCGDGGTQTRTTATVEVSAATTQLTPGQILQLTAVTLDAAGRPVNRAITWSSGDPEVAEVNASGLVTARRPGTAAIRATSDGRTGERVLTVLPIPIATVTITPQTATLEPGTTLPLEIRPRDAGGNVLVGRTCVTDVSDRAVATVDPVTEVLSALTAGTVTVTATCEGVKGTATVTVVPAAVVTVEVTPSFANLEVGDTRQFSAVARDARGNVLTGLPVAWSTSNPAAATVSASGIVTAVELGSANITATVQGKSAAVGVQVVRYPIATLVVSPPAATVQLGTTRQLSAEARDANGQEYIGPGQVVWSTSNPSVATVSAGGEVTAVALGSATVTATYAGKSASSEITVVPVVVASVTVSPASAALEVGQAQQFSAVARDARGAVLTGRPVTWRTANPAVATVSAAGVVTAVGPGSTDVVADVEGTSGVSFVSVRAASTPVSGIIRESTAWTRARSPYRLDGTVQVAYGATLTIEPGVILEGDLNRLEIFGVLNAVGTAAARISFRNAHVDVGANAPAQPARLVVEHAQFIGGSFYAADGQPGYGSFTLRDSDLFEVPRLYVWYPVADVYVERNRFRHTEGVSIGARAEDARVYVRNNVFHDWKVSPDGYFAVESWASHGGETVVLKHNGFIGSTRVAVRVKDDGRLDASENDWGTTSEAVIRSMVRDRDDDLSLPGVIPFTPFLTQPHPDTPLFPGQAPRAGRRAR